MSEQQLNGTIPKYYQISQDIIKKIKSNELEPGMKIPSENDIISIYNVSNTTARKALQEIVFQGWAYKVKGKGTFVLSKKVFRSADKILSFTRNMHEMGYSPSTRLIHKEEIKKDYSTEINGRVYRIKGPVYKIHRLRYADEIPMLLEIRYISKTLCPDIINEDLERSLYHLYTQKYNLHLSGINQMLSSIIIDQGVLDFFNLTDAQPGFLVDGVTFSGSEIILEIEKSIYRGDKYTFGVRASG